MTQSVFKIPNHLISIERKRTCLYFSRMFLLLLLLIQIIVGNGNAINLSFPENGTLWNGAFTPVRYHNNEMEISNESIQSYIYHSGKPLNIIAFSHEWSINRSFPIEQITTIHAFGAIPYVRLMLRTDNKQYRPEPLFTLKRIRDGFYDTEIRKFAKEAKELPYPLLIEYGTEMNGWWFSWNGYWTGKEKGTLLFQSVYRHIITLMKEEGADNLIWVFHINWHSNPEEEWNNPKMYYPGDELIDIIGISAYGALTPDDKNSLPFWVMMNEGYQTARNISQSKPVLLSEFGTDIRNPYTPADVWIEEAFSTLIEQNQWSHVIGFVWWNANWPNDLNPENNTTMRIEDDISIQNIFRKYLSSDVVADN